MPNLTTVHLVGSLGKRFGKTWQLEIKSPAEAIRAINVNTRGKLAEYLMGPARNKCYKVAIQKKDNLISENELRHRTGVSDIFIIPTLRGNNSGPLKIIIGVVLIIVGILTYMYGGGVLSAKGAALLGMTLVGSGASLVVGGISQLLTPIPKFQQSSSQGQQSTVFPGNAVAVSQGGSIPVVYGRALVPAVPISITVNNNDVSTPPIGTIGDPGYWNLNGGGQQYGPWGPN